MELSSGVVPRRIPCLVGSARARPRIGLRGNFGGVSMRCGFRDDGHVKYYIEGARCGSGGGKVEKEAEKNAKKKLKLVKGLYKELYMFSRMGFGMDESAGEGTRMSEAAEVLLVQLEQLKAEEKEMKRRRKEERAKLKAKRMKRVMTSSSSESSDSETGDVIDMSRMRIESLTQKPVEQSLSITQGVAAPSQPSTSQLTAIETPSSSSNASSEPAKKIEVCMGGKCRKSGGAALLEELQRAVGIEGAVVGCKCMGKCRDGPNVRVCNGARAQREVEGDTSVRVAPPVNPLCIGVGLEDVGVIVSNFLGIEQSDLDVGLSPAA
ncbi:hypothetical protein CRG98_036545 [Punica granatum]|nr:hypothetical protein CRG98_036545 [Punica granatum]